jgi:hemoglobin
MDEPTPYEALGGDAAVRALVDRFYDLMDTLPEAAGIRALHPADLASSREKLHLFLVGWLGGPATYVERFGHPRLRMRHLPFPIGPAERDAWLRCMDQALAEHVVDDTLRLQISTAFARIAEHMRNDAE